MPNMLNTQGIQLADAVRAGQRNVSAYAFAMRTLDLNRFSGRVRDRTYAASNTCSSSICASYAAGLM